MHNKHTLKPIGHAKGDGGTARVVEMVLKTIFAEFPTIDVDMSVEARIATNDACIAEAVKVFRECGSGFKNSTASDHPLIKKHEMKSANILMRPMIGAYAMFRLLQGPGRYKKPAATLRYGHGGYYDERECKIESIEGRRTAVYTQHMDLDDLPLFAQLALTLSKKHGLRLMLSSKSSIADSEKIFRYEIEKVWKQEGLLLGKDYQHKLSDIAAAELPVITADGSDCAEGGFLHVADNVKGDDSSDIIDLQHGNRVMGSQVYCVGPDGKIFTYEELASGTADKMETGILTGENFLNPVAINFALVSAFEKVNPGHAVFFNKVRSLSLEYLKQTPKEERDTEVMVHGIAEQARSGVFA